MIGDVVLQPGQRPLLEALTKSKDKLVKRMAKRALKRLGTSSG